jgi:hypothetical protein
MKRRALIIGNPGTRGTDSFLPGVEVDVKRYVDFLTSPLGGAWFGTEIEKLIQPSAAVAQAAVLKLVSFDFSIVVFSGHGWHSKPDDMTYCDLKDDVSIPCSMLRVKGSRQLVIVDCCRAPLEKALTESTLIKSAKEAFLSANQCRTFYDEAIMKCPIGSTILYAASIGEYAGDDSQRGGVYSHHLMRAVSSWAASNPTNLQTNADIISCVGAHDTASARVVNVTGGQQTPACEKPRTGPYYPLGVIA